MDELFSTTYTPRPWGWDNKSGQLPNNPMINNETHSYQQNQSHPQQTKPIPLPSKSTTPSIKSGKSIKIFFSGQSRGSLSKPSSATAKIRGTLKGFFHSTNQKHESTSNRSSIASVSTTNSSSTVNSIHEQNHRPATKQQSLKSTSSHDSLFLPLSNVPSKESFSYPADDTMDSKSDTFEALTTSLQQTDSTPPKLVTIQAKQRKRTSVQLLVSPTTKNTDIRMFYDRPLSLSMVPTEKQQKQQHQRRQQQALPSPPPSATLSERTSSFNHCQLDEEEKVATITLIGQQSESEACRGRTFSFSHGSYTSNDNSLYGSTQSQRQHHRLAHQRSVSPTVVSIHTEHAEPTFIRATTPSSDASQPTPLTTSSSTTVRLGGGRIPGQTTFPSSTSPKATKPPTSTTAGVTREHLLKVKSRQGLKSYRSDGDLGRLKSIFMPSASTSSGSAKHQRKEVPTKPPTTCSSTTIKPPLSSPPPLGHSSSLQSLSSMLRPLTPQRTPSTRVIHKSSCSNLKEMHDSQLPTITTASSTKVDSSSPWNLLRHVRKNSSMTSLKRSAASFIQETEHFTKYGPFAENTINNSSEGSVLHLSENGQDVLVMEMVDGRFQVVAGTREKLFIKLADETTQDFSYVDAYVLNHADFTTSEEFLENLMARFHIEPQPGETDYFKKWQRVLNIISRWIKLQYQDFVNNPILLVRLQAFISGDITRGGFTAEASNIKGLLHDQVSQHSKKRFSTLRTELHRRHQQQQQIQPHRPSAPSLSEPPVPSSPVLSLDAKEMAQYLTLADFYLLKCITANDFLHGSWRSNKIQQSPRSNLCCRDDNDYIHLMTKRANMLGGWTKSEVHIQQTTKNRTVVLKKMVEIASLCLEWNNFHTSMIILASLLDPCIQKLDEWAGLSSRDLHTFHHMVKLLDVSNNMGAYRQALGKAKSPTVPFFPLLLKDLTFFMDGNPTYLSSATISTPPVLTTDLINFAKYRSLTRCVHGILRATSKVYFFATDLGPWFFLQQDLVTDSPSLPLDRTAILLEQRIRSANDTQGSHSCGSSSSSSLGHAGS